MKEFKTTNGHIVFEVEILDCMIAEYGGICDICNDEVFTPKSVVNGVRILKKGYYVPVLNYLLCEDCFKEWSENTKYEEEDRKNEEINAAYFRKNFVQ